MKTRQNDKNFKIEYTIAHDDGRNPQDLPLADIVLHREGVI
ncbi:kinase/pyrophosphorylase [Cryptobacterium curtum]|nr:kinase/pyrophosphorylase [Cryptobacterium curtum]